VHNRVALDAVRDVDQQVQVRVLRLPCEHALHDAIHQRCLRGTACTVRGFGAVETRDALEHAHHAGGLRP